MVASYKMAGVGIIVAITSLAFLCNNFCFVGGQHDPIRPKLSESFLTEVGILSLAKSLEPILCYFALFSLTARMILKQYTRSGLGTELRGKYDQVYYTLLLPV